MTDSPLVTVAIIPRERFSLTREAVESVYATAALPFELLCIDGGSPPPVRDWLAAERARRGFRLIRTEHFLFPNVARNLALAEVSTKYVVFIDNDVVCAPGWLERLLGTAEETQADVCGPLICIGKPLHTNIHSGFGLQRLVEGRGRRYFRETNPLGWKRIAEMGPVQRQESERFEFHCVLFRRDFLERIGGLDEALTASAEHQDAGLCVSRAGGKSVFEPAAVVTYAKTPLEPSDVAFFDFRWRLQHVVDSEAHFQRKWNVVNDDFMMRHFILKQRTALWPHLHGFARIRIPIEWLRIFLSKLRLAWRYNLLPRFGLGPDALATRTA